MYISSETCPAEKAYTQHTFEIEKLGNMVNLVENNLVKVRVDCVEKQNNNLIHQKLFSLR